MSSEIINLNDSTPAAPGGTVNVTWQKGATTGNDPTYGLPIFPVSAHVPQGATSAGVQQEAYTYAADTGAANAYVVTLSPTPTVVAGSQVVFKAANANTGASTVAVNGGTATAIKKDGATALAGGDIASGQIISLVYDGTNWQIVAGSANSPGMANPMTTVGDLIVGGAVTGGVAAPARLADGASGYVLTANGAGVAPSYQPAAGGPGAAMPRPNTARWWSIVVNGSNALGNLGTIIDRNWVNLNWLNPTAANPWCFDFDEGTGASGTSYVRDDGDLNFIGNNSFFQALAKITAGNQRSYVGLLNVTLALNGADNATADFAMFRYSTTAGDTNWQCMTCDNTTITIVDSGVAAVGSFQKFELSLSASSAIFKINGVTVATITTHLPRTSQALRGTASQYAPSTNTVAPHLQVGWLYGENAY